jgi:hypothetical protein
MSGDSNTRQPDPAPAPAPRKPYAPPEIKEYGSISTLTRTSGLTTSDGPGKRKARV